jgi:signal transduction histidine kinase
LSLPLLLAIATAFGVSSTVQAHLLSRVDGFPPMLWHTLLLNMVYWYVPALLAPANLALASRYQVGQGRSHVSVPIHIAAALGYSVFHTAIMLLTRAAIMPDAPQRGWWFAARVEYLRQLDWLLMTYLFLVGLGHALAYRRESERRTLDAAHLQTRLVEAQLQALQRQLHPHFLFNTLNAIAGLMRADVDAADRMMDRLGDLLRITLNSSHVQEVPLREELATLEKYLDIEQTRFGPRLRVTLEIEPTALEALVPNFLLQPLVENAVRHGIAPHTRPGHIHVVASHDARRLSMRVVDSGDGMAPSRLTLLNQGVGLSNTRARLEHLYHGDHAFVFANVEGGFEVRVEIPFAVDPAAEPAQAGAA